MEGAKTVTAEKCRALEKQNSELKLVIRRLTRLAYIDVLTGLANRRYLQVALDSEIRRAVRSSSPLTFMLCDVDYFKRYNDRFGHQCGDAVLRTLGETLAGHCRRAGDVAARYGGEEFAMLLPGIDAVETLLIAERLRQSVAALSIRHAALEEPAHITVSIGVTTFRSSELCTTTDVIRAADFALYRAKRAGRNRTRYHAITPAGEPKPQGVIDSLHLAS